MFAVRRACAVFAGLMMLGASGSAVAQTALSDSDRLSYTTAFDQLRRGLLDEARATARRNWSKAVV